MTTSPVRGTDSTSSVPSRSLFSRLRSPLQSKTRYFTDFYIQPDDPHRQYAPGDIISGSVILKVIKPLRVTHLVVTLHGYAQVFKNPNSPGDAYKNYSTTVGQGKGNKKPGGYFGNGFVSLFEDEVVLCGEGRLGEGVYHFNFELEFPSKGLPSSIDFERGTISYMLTSTVTRPTTISPTTSCDTKVTLADVIDIAPVPEPKPQIISLEPISRRARSKAPRKRPQTTESEVPAERVDAARNRRTTELSSVAEEGAVPQSPAPSDDSFESRVSSGASGTEYGIRSVHTTLDHASSTLGRTTLKGKTITATIELGKGGFLRGDLIPIRITVDHTKHVRSLKGIIVTLYRQARVDMHPALPIAPTSKGDKAKSEEYYPKSRTGLGGLSLSSAGSSHLFRKDLSQSFAPLFVDPRTLTADIKCSVRIPEEAFPSISNVPGAMISFKYYVEVVVDIQGKLSGLDRMLPNSNTVVSLPTGIGSGAGLTEDSSGSVFSTWGGTFADTDPIRREKGVISCLFEVVIGTKDSERNGKKKLQAQPKLGQAVGAGVHEFRQGENGDMYAGGEQGEYYDYNYAYDQNGQYYNGYGYDNSYWDAPGYQATEGAPSQPFNSPPPPISPRDANGEELSEKERIRRAEAVLLPSAPPVAGESSSAPLRDVAASAPILPDDDYTTNPQYFAPESSASASQSQPPPPPFATQPHPHPAPLLQRRVTGESRPATNGSSLTINANLAARQRPRSPSSHNSKANGTTNNGERSLPFVPPQPREASQSSPAPDYFPGPSSHVHVQPTDDKQELQRRRLEMETSAPPTNDHDDSSSHGPSAPPGMSGSSAPPVQDMRHLNLAPSAPVLDEEDEGLVDAVRPGVNGGGSSSSNNNNRDSLPVYRR